MMESSVDATASNPLEIIPIPQKTTIFEDDSHDRFSFASVSIVFFYPHSDQLAELAGSLASQLGECLTQEETDESIPGIHIRLLDEDCSAPNNRESYTLEITSDRLLVKSTSLEGLQRGLQTVCQLHDSHSEGSAELPLCRIEDGPLFEWRGALLDCSRHFMDVDFVIKFIELLAYHKMNIFHWHLVDDQGWRIEIPSFPELTSTGAWRRLPTGEMYGGYYTEQDIERVNRTAEALGITIVPEIELPGHCMATLASYPHLGCTGQHYEVPNEWGIFEDVYCAGNEDVFKFLYAVYDSVLAMFPNSPYIHIGGDEVPKTRWRHCEKCQQRMKVENLRSEEELQSWFVKRMATYLNEKGRILIGWDEIHEGGLPQGAIVQSWRGVQGAVEAVRLGHRAICSPTSHCYFDYPISRTDLRRCYEFDAIPHAIRDNPEAQSLISGGECCMWTEHAPQDLVLYKVYPRLLAIATKLWTSREVCDQVPFDQFHHIVIDTHRKRLRKLGVDYENGVDDMDWDGNNNDVH